MKFIEYILNPGKERQLYKNIFTLTTGTTVAQAIAIAISPVLTRIYEPAEFGNLALFVSLINILTIIATGRYEQAIMLPKKKNDAKQITGLTIGLTLTFSVVLLIVVLLFSKQIAVIFKQPEIAPWLLLLPLAVFLHAVFYAFESWSNREKKYKDISLSKITQSGLISSSKLAMGFAGFGTAGMIVSTVLGYMGAAVFLFNRILKGNTRFFSEFRISEFKKQANQYKKFFQYTMPSNLINNFSLQLPVFLLTSFFSASIVGFYSLAHRIITVPMSLIGRSVSQVYYQNASELRGKPEELKEFTFGIYKKLLYLGVLPFSLLGVWGDYLFGFVFGSEWSVAGQYAQYLSIWILFNFISSPISQLFSVLEIQEKGLVVNVLLFIFRLFPLLLGIALFSEDPLSVIITFSILSSLFWIGFSFYLMKLAGVKFITTFIFTFKTIFIVFIPLICIRLLFGL